MCMEKRIMDIMLTQIDNLFAKLTKDIGQVVMENSIECIEEIMDDSMATIKENLKQDQTNQDNDTDENELQPELVS